MPPIRERMVARERRQSGTRPHNDKLR
jgi:hypothetical protein